MAEYNLHPPANSIRERKRLLNTKVALTYKRPATIIKARKLHAPCLSKTEKQLEGMWRPCIHCALCCYHRKQQIHGHVCFTNNDKTRNLPAEAKPDIRKPWSLCSDLLCCEMSHQQYVGQIVNVLSCCQPNQSKPALSYTFYKRSILSHIGESQRGFVALLDWWQTVFQFQWKKLFRKTYLPVL